MVDGVALAKKHQRSSGKRSSSGQQLQQGGIIDVEMFVDVVERADRLQELRQAHARRPSHRGRQEAADLPQVRGGAVMAETYVPRLEAALPRRGRAAARWTSSASPTPCRCRAWRRSS